jgi:hypothetical protein
MIGLILLSLAVVPPQSTTAPPPAASVAAEASQLRFCSDLWMNLHHSLYAAAWARRPEAGTLRALAGKLPSPLEAPFTPEERTAWHAAVDYYDRNIATRDLLFGEGMDAIKAALAAHDLSSPAIGKDLRDVLESAEPVYRRHFWPSHDRINREWIAATTEKVRTIAPETIARLEKLYATPWFSSAVRVDVVWVGNRQGAYTTTRPPHVVISSGDPENTGWTAVETVFHEVSHVLVRNISSALTRALGDRSREHGQLWHVVQFYLTGAAVQEVLRSRGIEYVPYLYSTGLLDRAWPKYKKPVEESWKPYFDGAITMDEAVARTVAALGGTPGQRP